MAPGIRHQGLRRVEAHRLRAQQGGEECGRVVQSHPRARVDEQAEAQGVALGEAEPREGLDARVDVVGVSAHDAVAGHALVELGLETLDLLHPALGAHRASQQVGVIRGAAAHGDGDLHELLLEDRDAQRALQGLHELGVQVGDLLLPELAPDIRMHRPALDRTWPHQRDLDDQVVELARLKPRQQSHLGAGFHLEDPDRIRPAQLVVDALLLLGDRVEVMRLAQCVAHQIEAVLQRREHAEAEQVELDQAHPGAVVLVPLNDCALLHARVLDRNHLTDRPLGEHHAARVDAQVPGELHDLHGQTHHRVRDVVVGTGDSRTPALHLLRPRILLAGTVPHRLGHVAHRELGSVLDDVGHLRRVLPTVLVEDVLDDLLTALRLEVDIDVGLLLAHGGDEALERQFVADRVDRGDLEQVADDAAGRRSATLTQDAAAPGLAHDVPHDQEVPREVLGLDGIQLLADTGQILGCRIDLPIGKARPDQLAQVAHGSVSGRHLLVGQGGLGLAQLETQFIGDDHCVLHGTRVSGESDGHLRAAAQVGGAGGG